MPTSEPFEIPVEGTSLHGTLTRADKASPDKPAPAVLVCGGYPVEADDFSDLQCQIVEALTGAGLTVATFEPRFASRAADDLDARRADQTVDDAARVFATLAGRTDIDDRRIGLLGYSSAAVVAACLAGRTDRVAALGLVAPADEDSIVRWMLGKNGVDSAPGAHTGSGSGSGSGSGPDGPGDEPVTLPPALEESIRSLFPHDEAAAFDRPTLIVHGAADRAVPVEVSQQYARRIGDALHGAEHGAEHVLVARADHGFSTVESRVACLELLMRFFSEMPPIDESHHDLDAGEGESGRDTDERDHARASAGDANDPS